jgi:hypothetical protein
VPPAILIAVLGSRRPRRVIAWVAGGGVLVRQFDALTPCWLSQCFAVCVQLPALCSAWRLAMSEVRPIKGSVDRNLNLSKAAGRRSSDSRGNLRQPTLDQPPSRLAEYHDCEPAPRQILLISDVAIGSEEHIESGSFRGIEKLNVSQP